MDILVKTYKELVDGINSASKGDTIVLDSDITVSESITFSNTCNIDINGKSIEVTCKEGFKVPRNVTATFYNGNISSNSPYMMCVQGANSNIILKDSLKLSSDNTIISAKTGGTIRLDGAELAGSGEANLIEVTGANSKLRCTSGSIISTLGTCILVKGDGTAVIGGTTKVKTSSETHPAIIVSGKNSILTITDECKITSDKTSAIHVLNGSTCVIEGGHVRSSSLTNPTVLISGANSSVKVVGGKVESTVFDSVSMNDAPDGSVNCFEMVGGELNAGRNCIISDSDNFSVKLTGGKYIGNVDEKYLPSGKEIVDGEIVDKEEEVEPPVHEIGYSIVLKTPTFIPILPESKKGFIYLGAITVYKNEKLIVNDIEYVKVRALNSGLGNKSYGYLLSSLVVN